MTQVRRGLGAVALIIVIAASGSVAVAKDAVAPSSSVCSQHQPASAAWRACLAATAGAASDADLYHTGYWLARTGDYHGALRALEQVRAPDERVLTYIGFATRKLGRVAESLTYYERALALNPDFVVARAYLGEAHLARKRPDLAKAELAEIERRCGRTCDEFAELSAAIARDNEG